MELLLSWEKSGASVATICDALDYAIDNANRPPRDLFACKKYVEQKIGTPNSSLRLSRKPTVSTPKPDPIVQAIQKLEDARSTAEHEAIRAAYTRALEKVEVAPLDEVEDELLNDVIASLSTDEHERFDETVRSTFATQLARMSPKAAQATFVSKRNDALREHFGLVTLIE